MTILKKKFISVAIVFCIIMASFFTFSQKAYACGSYLTWSNDAKLINGVGSYGNHVRYYWIDSSASEYTSLISQARYNWVNTSSILTTSILIRQNSVQSSSVFDIYKRQEFASSSTKLAISYFYDTSNQNIGTPTYDYKWTEIVLNTSNFDALSDFNKLGTITHEFGHCMGLAHTTNRSRIMCKVGDGRYVNTPTYADLETINHIYG